jgi:hypothetical protein
MADRSAPEYTSEGVGAILRRIFGIDKPRKSKEERLKETMEYIRGWFGNWEAVRIDYLDEFRVEKEECRDVPADPESYPFTSGDCVMEIKECRLTLRHKEFENLVLEIEGILIDVSNYSCELKVVYKPRYKITVEGVG